MLKKLLEMFTGARYFPKQLETNTGLVTFNLFRLFEKHFGRKVGIRVESETHYYYTENGYEVKQKFHTLESFIVFAECYVRSFAFSIKYQTPNVSLPNFQLAYATIALVFLGLEFKFKSGSMWFVPFMGAIAYDNKSSANASNTNAYSYNHTVSGSDRFFLAGQNVQNGDVLTSFKYAGVDADQILKSDASTTGFYGFNYAYGLIAPTIGTNSVSATMSTTGWVRGNCITFSGVEQTKPVDTYGATNNNASTNTVTLNVKNSNCWIWSWFIMDNYISSDATHPTGYATDAGNDATQSYSNATVSAGSNAITWSTNHGSQRNTQLAVAFRTAGEISLHTNLVSFWKMNGNALDSVGSNHGTATSVTFSTANGKVNQGAGGMTTASKIEVANASNLSPTSQITLACWVNTTNTASQYHTFIAKGNTAQYILRVDPNVNKYEVYLNLGGTLRNLKSNSALVNGVWKHIVATYDGTTVKLYIDGKLDNSASFSGSIGTGSAVLGIGHDITDSGNNVHLIGAIDEVGIWSSALTADQVFSLYNAGSGLTYPLTSSLTSPLIAHWKLNSNSNDELGFFNGTDTNMSYASALLGNGATFNGTSSYIEVPSHPALYPTEFTVSLWVKFSTAQQYKQLFSIQNATTSPYNGMSITTQDVASATKISAYLSGTTSILTSTSALNDNRWHNIVVTFKDGVHTLYVDGVQNAQNTGKTLTFDKTLPLRMGVFSNYTSNGWFNGSLDEVSYWGKAFSLAEVRRIFNGGFGLTYPFTSSLLDAILAYYKLESDGTNSVGSPNGTVNNLTFGSSYGKISNGANFNGSSSGILLSTLSNVGKSNFSFSAWVKTSSTSGTKEIIGFAATAPSYTPRNFIDPIIAPTTGYLQIEIGDQGGLNTSYADNLNITDNVWHHVVYTFKNSAGFTGKIYVDGVLRVTNTNATEYDFDQLSRGWSIGRGINYYNGAGYNWFNGSIDEVGIWLKELSDEEVLKLYNSSAGFTYPFSNATAYSITKSLKYSVKYNATAVTKSLKYTTRTSNSITKSLKYTVKATPSAITKSLAYKLKSAVSGVTKNLKYGVVKTYSVTKSLSYKTLTFSPIQKSLGYFVTTTPSAKTKSLTYAVKPASISITKSARYALVKAYSVTKALVYSVSAKTFDILVVAGGGGGGNEYYSNGGGGAGGYKPLLAQTLDVRSYAITIGLGGEPNNNGGNTVFEDIFTAIGGGRGATGSVASWSGGVGGSGGGGGWVGGYGAGTSGQGYAGGAGNYYGGGQGGGSSAVGASNPNASQDTDSANGTTNSITGSPVVYAKGGKGTHTFGSPEAGENGTGNGGSGTMRGGDGVVIIRYKTSEWGNCTGGTITYDGDYTIHTFTTNGTFTVSNAFSHSLTKALKYTVKIGNSITKSLKYALKVANLAITKSLTYKIVLTPTGVTKSLRYAIKINPAITKSLSYKVKYAPAISKSLKYTVKVPQTAITKSLQYYTKVASYLQKTFKYAVKTTKSAITKSLKYTIEATATAVTKTSKYAVKTSYSTTKSLKYVVPTPSNIALAIKYAIKTTNTITKSLVYKIEDPASVEKSLSYKVKAPANKNKELKYTVATTTKIQKTLRYAMPDDICITKSLRYVLHAPQPPIQKSLKYVIVFRYKLTKSLTYCVMKDPYRRGVKKYSTSTGYATKRTGYTPH